jgi:transposase
MAVIDEKGKMSFSNGTTNVFGREKLCGKLRKTDKVAIEAGNLSFILAKEIIAKTGCEVVVLNPYKLAVIYMSDKKTDKNDSAKLAQLIQTYNDEHLPKVAIPSDEEMARRQLLAEYRREKQSRSRCIHRLHALFHQQGLTNIVRKDLATKENRDKSIALLTGQEAEEAKNLCAHTDLYEQRCAVLKERIESECKNNEEMQRLQTIPGIGPIVAFAFHSYVGEASRFSNSSQVCSYLGLVPRVSQSGQMCHYGHITKRGNGYLRSLLVQAAWVAATRTKETNLLKEKFIFLSGAKGKKKAIAAVARKLAALMWTLLKTKSDFEFRKFTPPPKAKTESQKLAALAEELQAA